MRIATLTTGVITLITGIWAYANSGVSFLALAFVVGLVLVITGAMEAAIYMYSKGGRNDNNVWMLWDAALTIVTGFVTISGTVTSEVAIPYLFGMWLTAAGLTRLAISLTIDRRRKRRNYLSALVIGLVCLAAGLVVMFNDVLFGFSAGTLIGISVMAKSVATFEIGFNMPHAKVIDK